MTHRRATTAAAIAATLSLLAATGCTNNAGGTPQASDPPVVATAPASDGGNSSPTSPNASDGGGDKSHLPEENRNLEPPKRSDYLGIKHPTSQGAEATARYFIDSYFYAFSTGDLGPLRSVSTNTCSGCQNAEEKVEQFLSDSRIVTFSGVEEIDIESIKGDSQTFVVLYRFVRLPVDEYVEGENVASHPRKDHDSAIELTWQDSMWKASKVSIEAISGGSDG